MRIAKLLNCYIVKLIVGSEDGKMRGYQRGQVLIISLLVLVVALTVGLSVAVRTITTTRMTAAEDTSQRAFSAAEAGLERALTAGADFSGVLLSNNSSYSTSTSELPANDILVDNGAFISKDDPVDVWLSDYPDYINPWTGNLTIYWGNSTVLPSDVCDQQESINTMAAVEVILLSGSSASPTIDHFAYDHCVTRRNSNNFDPDSAGGFVAGKNFAYSVTIPITNGLLARVIPLYAGTYIGVRGSVALPSQGKVITSVGCSGSTAADCSGGTQRKIVSFRGYPKAPVELYPFLIFSPK